MLLVCRKQFILPAPEDALNPFSLANKKIKIKFGVKFTAQSCSHLNVKQIPDNFGDNWKLKRPRVTGFLASLYIDV